MKARWLISITFILLARATFGIDLAPVDKTIGKEPSYKERPAYALLVFGPEAKTRVWLVQDGDTIYVDRNANGDLTEPGEKIDPTKVRPGSSYRDRKYSIGTLTPADKTDPHTDFEITAYGENNGPWNYVLKLKYNGKIQQFAGWKPLFKESPQKALILHFGGPLFAQPIRYAAFSLKEKNPELHLRFATRGVGEFSSVSLGYEAIPRDVEPVALIEWPGSKTETVKLLSRC